MRKIVSCAYNMDTGCVELRYADGGMYSIDCTALENEVAWNMYKCYKVPYITCAIRDKEIKLTPEEAVLQLYIYKLMDEYRYAAGRNQLKTPIHFDREVKRDDIAIMDKDRPMVPYIIV